MKKILKKLFWWLSDRYLIVISHIGLFARADKIKGLNEVRRYAVLAPSSVGNIGDEAMVKVVINQLRARNLNSKITLITHEPTDSEFYESLGVDFCCLNGYFDKIPSIFAIRELLSCLVQCTDFVLLGADVVDGRYSVTRSFRRLLLAKLAERLGLRVCVIGFSFSHSAAPRITRFLRIKCAEFHYLCRDAQSADRLSDVLEKNVDHGADLAFLLPIPHKLSSSAAQVGLDHVYDWRQAQKKVVVFNANPLALISASPGISLDVAALAMADGVSLLAEKTGCVFLFLTHNNRLPNSDAYFMGKIIERLEPTVVVYMVSETLPAQDIKFLCQKADLTVTGRMHLGIASLGAGTATMILDFQGKVRGLFDLFQQPQMVLDVKKAIDKDEFSELVSNRLEASSELSEEVRSKLNNIRYLSAKNIDLLGGGKSF